jgi:hypothetical protein
MSSGHGRRRIPPALPGGRPRTDMRAAMNAILYLLRTGCPWRYLPRDSFPPCSTVYNIFRKSSAWSLGGDLGLAAYGIARANGSGGQPLGGGSRQPVDQIGRKRGGNDNQVGHDAGKEVKRAARSTPWLTARGCRCGSLSTPPRFKTATGRVWFSTRYPAASLGSTRSGLKASTTPGRFAAVERCRRCAWRSSSGATIRRALSSCRAAEWSTHLLLVRPQSASRQGLREPRRNLGHLRYPRLYPAGPQAARQGVGCGPRYTVTKVGKSDCEGTFAGASGNDEDAP